MKDTFFYIIVLILLASTSEIKSQLSWNGNWALACDFIGNDLANANVRGEDCSNKCYNTAGCTHFTWTTWNGGTCWMKKGSVSKNDAVFTNDQTMVCGVIVIDQGSIAIK